MSLGREEKAGIYFLFSRLFREAPDFALVRDVIKKRLLTLASQRSESLEESDWIEKVEEIAVEHTSLFIIPGESHISSYESFYCDALTVDTSTADSPYYQPACIPEGMRGFIYGTSAVAVEKAYRENGFDVDSKFHDLPDHIACELEFVGRLYKEGKGDRVQSFIYSHLGRWIFPFLTELNKQERSVFYKRVARSMLSFLKSEEGLS